MEEVNKMNNESFWKVMKEGEEQFEGLYEVLVYKERQCLEKGDFYDARIVEHVLLFCQSVSDQSGQFAVWLDRLCVCLKACPNDEMAHHRVNEIWALCNDFQAIIQRRLWVPYDMPSANNQFFK